MKKSAESGGQLLESSSGPARFRTTSRRALGWKPGTARGAERRESESTASRYFPKGRDRSPGRSCWTFFQNHLRDSAAGECFVVPTATVRQRFEFPVLSYNCHRIVHFNVTTKPTAEWTPLLQAFPDGEGQARLRVRDRDSNYGSAFTRQLEVMGIREALIAPRSRWERIFAERVIGSKRRECLERAIAPAETRRILVSFVHHYDESRVHSSVNGNSPIPRAVRLLYSLQRLTCGRTQDAK